MESRDETLFVDVYMIITKIFAGTELNKSIFLIFIRKFYIFWLFFEGGIFVAEFLTTETGSESVDFIFYFIPIPYSLIVVCTCTRKRQSFTRVYEMMKKYFVTPDDTIGLKTCHEVCEKHIKYLTPICMILYLATCSMPVLNMIFFDLEMGSPGTIPNPLPSSWRKRKDKILLIYCARYAMQIITISCCYLFQFSGILFLLFFNLEVSTQMENMKIFIKSMVTYKEYEEYFENENTSDRRRFRNVRNLLVISERHQVRKGKNRKVIVFTENSEKYELINYTTFVENLKQGIARDSHEMHYVTNNNLHLDRTVQKSHDLDVALKRRKRPKHNFTRKRNTVVEVPKIDRNNEYNRHILYALEEFIEFHHIFSRYTLTIIDAVEESFIVSLICSLGCCTLFCYCLVTTWVNSNYAMIFLYSFLTANIFFIWFRVCALGEQVLSINETAVKMLYELEWYQHSLKFQKTMLLFMTITERNIQLKAGIQYVAGFPLMLGFTKLIYSYFNAFSRFIRTM